MMKRAATLLLALGFALPVFAQDYERNHGVKRSTPAAVVLDQARPAAKLTVGALTLHLHHVDHRKAGNFTWVGTVQGYPGGRAVLTSVDGVVSGYVYLGTKGSDPTYEIRTDAKGKQTLVELDPKGFPDGKADTLDHVAPAAAPADVHGDTGAVIDVMVLYSNQTAAAAGAGIGAAIQNAIDVSNQVFANSGISFRFNLAYSAQVAHDELGDQTADVNWLAADPGVASLRNAHYADLVAMYVEESGGYCGMSYGIGPNVNIAWSVINRGCAVGNLSFPHELGHLLGARHDMFVDSTPGVNHGWVDCAEAWRTVMAYPTQCGGTRLQYFSNPLATYGTPADPMGNATTADNVRTLNGNAVTVANFRSATAPPPPPVSCTLSPNKASPVVNTTVTLSAVCAGSPTAYVWTNCFSTTSNCNTTNATVGTVTYMVTASNGTTSSTAQTSVNWIAKPTCTPRGNSGKCK
jgi:hypothetical protein